MELWKVCRNAKQSAQPRLTNQDIADDSGVSVNTVSQFLRGETQSPSVDTVGPICASLGVSLDDHYGVSPPAASPASPAEPPSIGPDKEALYLARIADLQRAVQRKERWNKRLFALCICFAAFICLLLAVDFFTPSIGIFR